MKDVTVRECITQGLGFCIKGDMIKEAEEIWEFLESEGYTRLEGASYDGELVKADGSVYYGCHTSLLRTFTLKECLESKVKAKLLIAELLATRTPFQVHGEKQSILAHLARIGETPKWEFTSTNGEMGWLKVNWIQGKLVRIMFYQLVEEARAIKLTLTDCLERDLPFKVNGNPQEVVKALRIAGLEGGRLIYIDDRDEWIGVGDYTHGGSPIFTLEDCKRVTQVAKEGFTSIGELWAYLLIEGNSVQGKLTGGIYELKEGHSYINGIRSEVSIGDPLNFARYQQPRWEDSIGKGKWCRVWDAYRPHDTYYSRVVSYKGGKYRTGRTCGWDHAEPLTREEVLSYFEEEDND